MIIFVGTSAKYLPPVCLTRQAWRQVSGSYHYHRCHHRHHFCLHHHRQLYSSFSSSSPPSSSSSKSGGLLYLLSSTATAIIRFAHPQCSQTIKRERMWWWETCLMRCDGDEVVKWASEGFSSEPFHSWWCAESWYCVTRAPLLLLRSWVARSFKVVQWVRYRCHPTKSPLFSIFKGKQALYWPNAIKNQPVPPYTDSVPQRTNHWCPYHEPLKNIKSMRK